MQSLADAIAEVRQRLDAATELREQALRLCRQTVQLSSRAIRALHREDVSQFEAWLAEARNAMGDLRQLLRHQPAIYYAGYIHDAQKEYAEAALLPCITRGAEWRTPQELGVEDAAFLHGLTEAASEGRRYVLDRLIVGDTREAVRVLSVMDDVYCELTACDFPEAITGGLRRATDALRAVLERTRGDVALAIQQRSLQESLERYGTRE